MINVGYLGKTFGMLPSKIIQEATTYDIMIADVLNSWEKYQYDKASGKNVVPDYTQDELLEMMRKVQK